jgi:hypothetical protein
LATSNMLILFSILTVSNKAASKLHFQGIPNQYITIASLYIRRSLTIGNPRGIPLNKYQLDNAIHLSIFRQCFRFEQGAYKLNHHH